MSLKRALQVRETAAMSSGWTSQRVCSTTSGGRVKNEWVMVEMSEECVRGSIAHNIMDTCNRIYDAKSARLCSVRQTITNFQASWVPRLHTFQGTRSISSIISHAPVRYWKLLRTQLKQCDRMESFNQASQVGESEYSVITYHENVANRQPTIIPIWETVRSVG
jgi:hypothetical protein